MRRKDGRLKFRAIRPERVSAFSHQQDGGLALCSGVGCLLLASGLDPVAAESVLPFGFGGQLHGQADLPAPPSGDQRNVGLPVGDQPLAQRC